MTGLSACLIDIRPGLECYVGQLDKIGAMGLEESLK